MTAARCRGLCCLPGAMLAAAFLLGVVASPAPAQESPVPGPCPTAPVPAIRVAVKALDIVYDRSRTGAEIEAMGKTATLDWLQGRGHVLGQTEHRFGLDLSGLRWIGVPAADGGLCVGFGDGVVTLVVATTIHVDRRIPAASCLSREVVDHEWKHHDLALRLLDDHARDLEGRFAAALAARPLVRAASADAAQAAAEARLQEILAPARAEFDATYEREELAIDTRQEYQRVLDACPGEQQLLLDR